MNVLSQPTDWISTGEAAILLGISSQKCRQALARAHKGKSYRGASLLVRKVKGTGGAAGISYEVAKSTVEALVSGRSTVDSSLHTVVTKPSIATPALPAPAIEHEIARTALAAIQAHRDGDWIWRHEIIQPALAVPYGSTERSRIVADLSSCSHRTPSGELRRFATSTLYGWIKEYEEHGFEGINRQRRADRGQQRVTISRAWDDAAMAAGISPDRAKMVAAQVVTRVRSLWEKGAPSWRKVQDLATKRLIELSRAAGMDRPIAEMLELCRPSRKMIDREKNHKILAIRDKDAKQFFDKYTPRATRNYVGIFPMDMVVVDVHHMDNIKRRENGKIFTPKMICWFDIATNRVFNTIVFVGEGEGVRQEHIAQSFISMTQDAGWGLPRSLYMDNGSELARLGLADAAMQLANWARKQDLPGMSVGMLDDHAEVKNLYRAVRKSLAYNAPGKPGIEGHFGILERTLAPMMPGWIGGNRMVKKTQNVGKEPTPFEGSEEDFARSVGTLIDYYEIIPQSGKLKDKSPRQTFAAFVDAGWKRIDVDPVALAMVFATEKMATVTRGEFQYDNAIWRGDDLLPLLAGTKIKIRIPLVGPKDKLVCLDEDGAFLCIATPAVTFSPMDRAGAKERGHRIKVQGRHLKALRDNTEPVDLLAEVGAFAALHPPAPPAPSCGTVRLARPLTDAARAQRALAEPSSTKISPPVPDRDPTEIRRRILERRAG